MELEHKLEAERQRWEENAAFHQERTLAEVKEKISDR
jgi:hypothetical protein